MGTNAAKKTIAKTNITTPISEIISPAMAKLFGFLNNPINENNKPKNHKICPKIGIQHNKIAKTAKINPATPIPLV